MTTKTRKDFEQELYPDDDGLPMSDNTLQFEWITTIKGNLDALYRHDPNVFVGGNLLWYAVEGQPAIRTAPDALVVFGRPKGYRGSYKQWQEGNIAPQIVFEVLSPGNREADMARKFEFYERYGVEEYYLFDPDEIILSGWRRVDEHLQPILPIDGWTSPRLGIRFDLTEVDLLISRPDGERFRTFVEIKEMQERDRRRAEEAQRQTEEAQRQTEEAQRQTEEAQRQTEEAQRQTEEAQRQTEEAQRQTEEAQRQTEEVRQRAERLAAQLRALGIEPEA